MKLIENTHRELSTFDRGSRVVIYSPFFFPEVISTGKYNTYLAKAICGRGQRVEVIASHPLYPDWVPVQSEEKFPGVVVHRGGASVRYPKKGALRRVVLEFWFACYSALTTWRLRRKIDIAVFVFPPILFAIFVKLLLPKGCRVVGIVHDLQGLMISSGMLGGRGFIGKLVLAVEGYILRRCEKIVCLSNSMADVVTARLGVDKVRCKVCYPFAISMPKSDGRSLSELFPTGRVHVVYSGALGYKQLPRVLLDIFEGLCKRRPDIACHIFSRGPIFNELATRKKAGAPDGVHFHDLVPEDALGELYRRSDVQVIPQAPGTETAAFPSKLPNLLAVGVPVFAVCDRNSELGKIVLACGGGACPPDEVSSVIIDELSKFIDDSILESHEQRQSRLREYIESFFSIEKLVDIVLKGDQVKGSS